MLDALFSGNAIWFSVPALLGSSFFLIRFAALAIGGHDHAIDHAGADGAHGAHTDAMQLLSVQSVTGFLMGFGWGGLGALKGTTWDMVWVIATAVAFGIFIVWIQLLLLSGVRKLHASGNISIDRAMGTQGVVYVEIPAANKGKGQVTVVLDGRQRTLNAITSGELIPSKTRVDVIAVNPDNTVTVRKAS